MKNYFGGIHSVKRAKFVQRHINVMIVQKENQENFARCFCRFLKRTFGRKSQSTGRNDELKPDKLLSLTERIGNEIGRFLKLLL